VLLTSMFSSVAECTKSAEAGSEPPNVLEALTYVSFQEKATAVAHRNTGKALGNELGRSVMQKWRPTRLTIQAVLHTHGCGHELWPDAAMIAVWSRFAASPCPVRD